MVLNILNLESIGYDDIFIVNWILSWLVSVEEECGVFLDSVSYSNHLHSNCLCIILGNTVLNEDVTSVQTSLTLYKHMFIFFILFHNYNNTCIVLNMHIALTSVNHLLNATLLYKLNVTWKKAFVWQVQFPHVILL